MLQGVMALIGYSINRMDGYIMLCDRSTDVVYEWIYTIHNRFSVEKCLKCLYNQLLF